MGVSGSSFIREAEDRPPPPRDSRDDRPGEESDRDIFRTASCPRDEEGVGKLSGAPPPSLDMPDPGRPDVGLLLPGVLGICTLK